MHINIIHIITAIYIGAVASLSRHKNGKVNLKLAQAISAVCVLVLVMIDWVRL